MDGAQLPGGIVQKAVRMARVVMDHAGPRRAARAPQLDRALDKLPTDGRPLSQNADLAAMAAERGPLYARFRDALIDNNAAPADAAGAIWRDFCADLDPERT